MPNPSFQICDEPNTDLDLKFRDCRASNFNSMVDAEKTGKFESVLLENL